MQRGLCHCQRSSKPQCATRELSRALKQILNELDEHERMGWMDLNA